MLEGLRPINRADIDAIVALAEAVRLEDEPETAVTREMVEAQFDIPGLDITEMAFVLPDASGALVASVSAAPIPTDEDETVHISWTVHPDHRMDGLDEALLRFAEDRAGRLRKLPHMPGRLQVGVRTLRRDRLEILERFGYSPTRWFLEMERSLDGDLPDRTAPVGYAVRQAEEADRDNVFAVLEESFRDHWHQAHFTREQYEHFYSMMALAPLTTLVACTTEGEIAGASITRVSAERNAQHGVSEGEIAVLGVRREHRKRGLGRCLLGHSLAWLAEMGLKVATIDVDADSQTGANRLYEDVGFVERRRSVVYMKPMP